MNLFQLLRVLWVRRFLIGGIAIAAFLAALVAAFSLPRTYTGESRVVLDVIKPDPVTGDVLNSSFARAYVQTQVEMITDAPVAMRAVRILGWANDPSWQAEYAAEQKPSDGGIEEWLAGQLIGGASADLIEGTNILSITYSSNLPSQARDGAEALRKGYIEQSIEERRGSAGRNAAWFTTQAAAVRDRLTATEARKAAFERANGVVLQADNTDPQNERLKALASAPPPVPIAAAGAASTAAASALATLDAQIAAKSATLGPNHPDLIALRQQRPALASAAAAERAAAAPSASGPSINSQVDSARATVLAQSDKIAYLRQLQTQIDVLRDQFQKTSARAADFSQQAQARESGISEMGPATAPTTPSSPKVGKIVLGALLGGLAIGLMLAIVIELLRRKVRGPDDLAELKVPLLGIIAPNQKPRGVFAGLA